MMASLRAQGTGLMHGHAGGQRLEYLANLNTPSEQHIPRQL